MATEVKHAIRTAAGWASMSGAEQAEYAGYYTSLSAWEAALPASLVAVDEVRTAVCYNDWPSGLANVVQINGLTVDATRYVKITVADGHRHDGAFGAGFYLTASISNYNIIDIRANYTELDWLQFRNNFTGGGASSRSIYVSGISYCTYRNCISKNASNVHGHGFMLPASGVAINCLSLNEYIGFSVGTSATIYNCGVANSSYRGYTSGSGTAVAKNSFAFNCGNNWAASFSAANSSNNATSSGSDNAPGDSSVFGITSAAFVDSDGGNYHLAAGSALIGAGVNLYSTFTTDIDGDERPSSGAWGIGFDHYVAGAPATWSPKIWDGAAWTAKPAKRWDGAAWQPIASAKRWDGAAWQEMV